MKLKALLLTAALFFSQHALSSQQVFSAQIDLSLEICSYTPENVMKECHMTAVLKSEAVQAPYEAGACRQSDGTDCSKEYPFWIANFSNDYSVTDPATGFGQTFNALLSLAQFGDLSAPYSLTLSLLPAGHGYGDTIESAVKLLNLTGELEIIGDGMSTLTKFPDGSSVYVKASAKVSHIRVLPADPEK